MRERTDGEGFATRAIHAGERPDPVTHAHNTPIYATATFAFDTAAEKEDAVDRAMAWDPTAYFYSRTGNPTNRALEEKIASLEGAEDCVVAASGMASVAATLFAHLASGDHLVVGDELFAITTRADGGGPAEARDRRDGRRHDGPRGRRGGDHARDAACCSSRCSTNPRLRIADLDAIAALAHRHGAHRRRRQHVPRAGAAAPDRARRGPRAPRRDEVPVGSRRRGLGRGLRVRGADRRRSASRPTRSARRRARSRASSCCAASGRCRCGRPRARRTRPALAAFLEADPRVEWVRYPGLASHPDHAVATRMLGDRYGAMVTFQPRGGVAGDGGVHRPPPAVRHRREPGRRVHARLPAAEARRAGPRLGGLRGHRGPARPTSSSACRSSSSAFGPQPAGRPSAPAERRGGRERRADREVDAAGDLVLGRPEPRLRPPSRVAPPSAGSEITSDTVRMQPARTGRPLPCSRIAIR